MNFKKRYPFFIIIALLLSVITIPLVQQLNSASAQTIPDRTCADGSRVPGLSGICPEERSNKPTYNIEWANNSPGVMPLTLTVSWAKSFMTAQGVTQGNKIQVTEYQASSAPNNVNTIIYATIAAGSFNSNKECTVVLRVQRPTSDLKVVTVNGYTDEFDTNSSCSEELATAMNATLSNYGSETESQTQGPAGDTNQANTAEPPASEDESCEGNSEVLGWVMCPIAGLLENVTHFLDTQIQVMLVTKDSYFRTGCGADCQSGEAIMDAWKKMRNIAYIILLPAILVMVIGTALNMDIFSAYTIKKALPRMVIATIFIAVSWHFCVLLINVTNAVGAGTKGIISSSFSSSNGQAGIKGALATAGITSAGGSSNVEGGDLGLVALVGTGAVLGYFSGVVSIGIILSTLATAAIFLGGVFILLILRQIIIIGLLMLAPLAILSWIFPGNDKLWKLWWGGFTKLLMVFPLIMLVIAVGQSFANIAGYTAIGADGTRKLVGAIIIVSSYVVPYVFIPVAFKWAGGVFGNLAGMVNDREKGVFDRLKKGRSNMRAKHMGNAKNFQRFKGRNPFTKRFNTIGGIATNGLTSPSSVITPSRLNTTRSAAQAAFAAESLKNDKVYQDHKNDENTLLAVANKELAQEKLKAAQEKLKAEESKPQAEQDQIRMDKLRREVTARQNGLNNAKLVANRDSTGVRLAALHDLGATGYGFSDGDAGFNELSGTIRDIVGDDDASYGETMNSVQFALKSAGRGDLGLMDYGDATIATNADGTIVTNADGTPKRIRNTKSAQAAFKKYNSYARGQMKTATYTGAASAFLGHNAVNDDGSTLGVEDLTHTIRGNILNGTVSVDDMVEYHAALTQDHANATDINKVEIDKQLAAMQAAIEGMQMPNTTIDMAGRDRVLSQFQANRDKARMRDDPDPSTRTT